MGPQQNASDPGANLFWYLALLTLATIVLWYFERQYIIPIIFAIRQVEVEGLKIVGLLWNEVAGVFPVPKWDVSSYGRLQDFMATSDPKLVTIAQFEKISSFVGQYYRYPIMLVLSVLAFFLFSKHRSFRFTQSYSMNSLKNAEVENWPQITPVVSLDLVKEDLEKGPWAMAKLPLDFCREQNILVPGKEINGKAIFSIDQVKSEQAFVLQLGPLWPGILELPIHAKALCVIFMLKSVRRQNEANNFLDQIARSSRDGQLNFEGISQMAKEFVNHPLMKWLERHHAYVTTLMASLLEAARSDGVMASAEFLWLKPVDRRLWYMLNSIGRQTACVEVAGPFSHWIAEKRVKRSLKAPMVKQAVVALEADMNGILQPQSDGIWHINNAD